MYSDLAVAIRNKALELDYEKCGIITVSAMHGYAEKLAKRIERFPEVAPSYRRFHDFANLQKNYPWAKSVVVCVRRYGKYHIPEHLHGLVAKYYLVDSRKYTQSKDYQDSISFEKYLNQQGLHTATKRDFGITALRWAALEAGLGTIRKNNFLYTENSSWVHLEAWLIDKELEFIERSDIRGCPKGCNLCMRNCPTSSLSEPYSMNSSTCVSFLTTFGGWDLPNEKHNSSMGGWVFGCDVCQDVCPFNKGAWTDDEDFPHLGELSKSISLEKIIEMDYEFLRESMHPKFWYIGKDNVWRWNTNVLNAMLNNYSGTYDRYIDMACDDGNEHVREMAKWVKEKTRLKNLA